MRAVCRSEDGCHHRSGMHSTIVDRNARQSTLFFLKRVTFVTAVVLRKIGYDRDWSGQRAVVHYPDGRVLRYVHDPHGFAPSRHLGTNLYTRFPS